MALGLKILNTLGEHFAPKAKSILDTLGDVDYRELSHKELLLVADRYDVIVVGLYPMVDKEVMDKATKLKCIAIPANTLENIDVDYAKSKGIEVVSLWGELDFLNTITGTAELACGLMIDIIRFTPWAFDNVKEYKWEREKFRGHNLYEKTLGVVGMGRLGTWMARYGKAFGMEVMFYDPNVEESRVPECTKVSFEELLSKSDIISLHPHLNKETENMFNAEVFKKMKNEAYLINTARGRIVDEVALLQALERGEIVGYATDVLADEFYFDDTGLVNHPLIDYAKSHQNVIIVPHTGGMTVESRENTDIFTTEKLKKFLTKM
ncbi:MAG TPA: NAD(P)-dependent oxidoreductase [Candidatus Paceibacterota bacterium]